MNRFDSATWPATSPVLLLVALLLTSSVLGGCASDESDDDALPSTTFRHDGTLTFETAEGDSITTIQIEIADTDEARRQGLMHRTSMRADRGMLFIFDTVDTGGMWMRNTPMPLDMIFVDDDEQVINIAKNTRPFSEDSVEPEAPRRYVVEVRAGFADRHNLDANTRIHWERLDD